MEYQSLQNQRQDLPSRPTPFLLSRRRGKLIRRRRRPCASAMLRRPAAFLCLRCANHLCGASNAVACEETFWKPVKPKIETDPHSCASAEASAQSICYLPGSPSCSGGWPTQQRDPLDVWQGCFQNLGALKHKDEDKVLDFQTEKFSFQ